MSIEQFARGLEAEGFRQKIHKAQRKIEAGVDRVLREKPEDKLAGMVNSLKDDLMWNTGGIFDNFFLGSRTARHIRDNQKYSEKFQKKFEKYLIKNHTGSGSQLDILAVRKDSANLAQMLFEQSKKIPENVDFQEEVATTMRLTARRTIEFGAEVTEKMGARIVDRDKLADLRRLLLDPSSDPTALQEKLEEYNRNFR